MPLILAPFLMSTLVNWQFSSPAEAWKDGVSYHVLGCVVWFGLTYHFAGSVLDVLFDSQNFPGALEGNILRSEDRDSSYSLDWAGVMGRGGGH